MASNAIAEPPLTARQVIIRQTESFLTNPVLEALRKADQFEQDVPRDLDSETTKVLLLYPIVEINQELEDAATCLASPSPSCITTTDTIFKQPKYNPSVFKKIFNRYSDNIFYQDSKRANLYLGGGTTPDSQQTSQYLYRNSVLTNVEFAQQDVKGLLGLTTEELASTQRRQEVSDALSDIDEARASMKAYFRLADPKDLAGVKDVMESRK